MNQLHELHKTYNSLIAKEFIHSKHFLTKFENEQYGYTYEQKAMVDGVYTEYTDSNMTYEINSAGFRTKQPRVSLNPITCKCFVSVRCRITRICSWSSAENAKSGIIQSASTRRKRSWLRN